MSDKLPKDMDWLRIEHLETELSASQSREAELREKLGAAEKMHADEQDMRIAEEKLRRAAEAKIKASQEQEPYRRLAEMVRGMLVPVDVFTAPVIPPDLADLQRENAELRKLLEESKEPEWKLLTNYGQVKVGDRIMFELCGSTVKRTIGEILFGDTDKEEIIYDRGRNYYIITSMALKGEGNHKNVRHLPKSAQPPKESK